MKVSLNTLQNITERYGCAEDLTAIGVDELVTKIGAQLGAVDDVIAIGQKYQGIIIAKIVSCEKHSNADKLQVCRVDDGGVAKGVPRGDDNLVQVVCGAPNARAGLMVAWLPPGATVPETVGKEPFVLEAREIRGQVSNGMLASPKELALGDDHDGILEIDGDHQPGSDFAEMFGLKDDVVLEFENKMFTHRPDCFGFLGIARELAGIQQLSFKSPAWYVPTPEFPKPAGDNLALKIHNELPELVPRFTAAVMSGVKVGSSPVWLQVELAKLGQKSINNIVDYTNWFMLETGQPLHAYDYDKVKKLSESDAAIVVRHPKPGEKVQLLNGKEIEPRAEAIMIATDKQLIGIGGVMGGSQTEVDENTQNIILESANFDMYSVRRTSMAHGLFTDAVTRFTKGQSPLQNLAVLAKIVNEIQQYAGGQLAAEAIDDNHVEGALSDATLVVPVQVSRNFINSRLGLKLDDDHIMKLLENVEFRSHTKGSMDELCVDVPFWRTDIELPEDIVEEVGRLYGYDKLPLELPQRQIEAAPKDELFAIKAAIRERLSQAGANEILTYSFVHGSLLQKTGQDAAKAFEVANALSPDLQYYRLSLMPSLLEKVHPNIKAGYDEFALFEIGRTHGVDHLDDDGLPKEFEFSGLVVTAHDKLKKTGAAYYQARHYLEYLADRELAYKPVGDDMKAYPVVQPYNLERSALVSIKGGDFLGIVGEFKPSVLRALKLPQYTAGFEVDTTMLSFLLSSDGGYQPLSRFPSVKQDITLKVRADLPFQELSDYLHDHLNQLKPDASQATLEPVDIFQSDDKEHKHISFRLRIASYDRTLTDAEVNKLLDAGAEAAQAKFGAERL